LYFLSGSTCHQPKSRIGHQATGAAAHVGNIYVNRNMIGALVGVQPFGGEGLSGTGLKAGGPHYFVSLLRRANRDGEHHGGGGNVLLMA
jgi:RHH-type transcriptional regulator, proline utilization regulon repressor / proline dehydrogenase / delta 1-pyrroline-5-carboxylate dehydrogenase